MDQRPVRSSATPIATAPFKRGPDRRVPADTINHEKRHLERRQRGIGWIPLFQGADDQALFDVIGNCEVLLLPAGTPLLKPGESNHNVYIPLTGQLAAFLDFSQAADAAISIAPGDCIGELSAIDGKPASALVLATTDARVLKLPGDVFWNQLMALPGLARNMMTTLSSRMRRTNDLALKAQREHLELVHLRKELDVARQLQVSMLPLQRPLFPERGELEVCGFMEPASDVGGDLFDAFWLDPEHLFVCIGDVSGHGIAAALFMARTIGLLRMIATAELQPDAILAALNDRLCVGNETDLFVTMFCGILDVGNGSLRYSNGGHCAPILIQQDSARLLPIPKGALIGVFPGMRYQTMECHLAQGETVFCYTDGVTEAESALGEQYSEHRCLALLGTPATMPPLDDLLDEVRNDVARFTGSRVLNDDCTMLALRRLNFSKQ